MMAPKLTYDMLPKLANGQVDCRQLLDAAEHAMGRKLADREQRRLANVVRGLEAAATRHVKRQLSDTIGRGRL